MGLDCGFSRWCSWSCWPRWWSDSAARCLASGAVTDVICSLPWQVRKDGGSTLCVVRVRCPVLVGREPEMVLLADAVARARSGDGAAIFVVGAAGIGKSALARAAVALARGRGVLALVGRAVPRPSPTPYRALTEALLTGVGGEAFPPGPEMWAFRAALGRLVPQWRVAGDVYAEESPVVLGAGLLRLLRVIAPAGALLVLVLVLILNIIFW